MATTFGDQLRLFSLSVDVISQSRFDRVTRLIDEYCRDALDIEHTRLYLTTDIDGLPGLKRYSLDGFDMENVRPVRSESGKYCNQTGLAYERGKPLWIVSREGKRALVNCNRYVDQWSGFRSIPVYRPIGSNRPSEFEIRTSVIVPVRHGEDVLGVLNFESCEYIEITRPAKKELQRIAESLGILLHLSRVNEVQRYSTEQALANLQLRLSLPQLKLTKPKIFLASSSAANADVIESAMAVLREQRYVDRLDLVYWKAMDEPGNINNQLINAIAVCRYAICYLSQQGPDDLYVDNPNVLFEAGMFHGRVDEITPVPTSWIPVREEASTDLPFDFAQERILIPPRSRAGVLKTRTFAAALRKRIDALLEDG